MKTFKEYIMEMPVPAGFPTKNLEKLDPKVQGFIKSFALEFAKTLMPKYGTKLGQGSARLVYKVPVEQQQFTKEQLDLVGGNYKEKKIDTVIKIPNSIMLDQRGIIQCNSEYRVWEEYKGTEYAKWLCPVLDTSLTMLPNLQTKNICMIQMELCETVDPDGNGMLLTEKGNKKFIDTFGLIQPTRDVGKDDSFRFGVFESIAMSSAKVKQDEMEYRKIIKQLCENRHFNIMYDQDPAKAEQQKKNLFSYARFLDLSTYFDTHTGNYGIMPNGNLVLIDYAVEIR